MGEKKIRVAVVEGCEGDLNVLTRIMESDPEIEVVGTAVTGKEAVKIAERLKPAVMIIGSSMPAMNGLEAIAKIMSTHPLPIVMVCASPGSGKSSMADRGMKAGAVAVIDKPQTMPGSDDTPASRRLVNTVKLMSEVKVVRRREKRSASGPVGAGTQHGGDQRRRRRGAPRVVVIGVSTGGPGVLKSILSCLPASYPIPIVIAQHIAVGFTDSMVGWLDQICSLTIKVAVSGERIRPGSVYVAPGGKNIKIAESGRLVLLPSRSKDAPCPSVDLLFQSVIEQYGAESVGILLTGMGRDGAEGLKQMKETGAVTIVQDETSSTVFGMPGEAIKLGGAVHVLPPDEIAAKLEELAGTRCVLPR